MVSSTVSLMGIEVEVVTDCPRSSILLYPVSKTANHTS